MTTEEKIAMFEQSRERMHRAIDEKIDDIIECLRTGQSIRQNGVRHYDLSEPPFLFKSKKPVSITYPNGEKVFVSTWRKVAGELLNDCNSDPQRHEALMQLRHKIAGRNRWVLADAPSDMNVPIKVDEGLYFEGKFDTEYLLKMLTDKVFSKVGYPYEFIEVEVRETGQDIVPAEEHENTMSTQTM